MPEYKKQHFVPRSYLKNFSFDGGVRTNLIRLDDLRCIPAIPLADQCQDDYFYGRDLTIEKALGPMEGEAGKVIREIIRNGTIAPHGTVEDAILRVYLCFQWTRTEEYSEQTDAGLTAFIKVAFRERIKQAGISEEDMKDLQIGRTEGPRESVSQGADSIPFFSDLEPKLVAANGLGEFVTSDNPVVLINPFYHGRFPGGTVGIALEGTVILFPISPQYLVILYDRKCYRVGSPGKRLVPLGSLTDLDALNNFQFLNAGNNVYHCSAKAATSHTKAFSGVKGLRKADRNVVREIDLGNGKSLVHTFAEPINYKPVTSFMKVLKSRRVETDDVAQIPERDPVLKQHFAIYTEGVKNKTIPRGFVAYLANIASHTVPTEELSAFSMPMHQR